MTTAPLRSVTAPEMLPPVAACRVLEIKNIAARVVRVIPVAVIRHIDFKLNTRTLKSLQREAKRLRIVDAGAMTRAFD
jgi:hypothetical protein